MANFTTMNDIEQNGFLGNAKYLSEICMDMMSCSGIQNKVELANKIVALATNNKEESTRSLVEKTYGEVVPSHKTLLDFLIEVKGYGIVGNAKELYDLSYKVMITEGLNSQLEMYNAIIANAMILKEELTKALLVEELI